MERIKKFFSHPFIQLLGLPGIIAVITWIVTQAAQMPLWVIWLSTLFSVGCVFWIVNQVSGWKERHKKKLTQLSDKELESLIWEWLKISAWKINPQPLQVDTVFAYQVQFQDILIDVVKEKPQPEIIHLVSVFTMPSEKEGLSDAERNRLWGQLRIEFARLGIQWE